MYNIRGLQFKELTYILNSTETFTLLADPSHFNKSNVK